MKATGIRRTKLVCTLGPATADRIPELVAAGMDVARINLAHGSHDEHAAAAAAVRRAAAGGQRPVAILTDLAGPKIRLGELVDGIAHLDAGEPFQLRASPSGGAGTGPGDRSGVAVTYPGLAADVRVGDPIFLADGAVELRVTATATGDGVATEVVRSGTIRSRAGVAIPADRLSAPILTDRDRADIPRAIALGATFVGQSFVRSAADVVELRQLLKPDVPGIVAKVETRPAVESFDAILEVADAVMIARGDLGVEMPYEQVPLLQKQLLRRALDRGVPAIVATQMLESMTSAPRPTRAEASDVANAVFDGADAIMLSAETAIGAHPIEAAMAAAGIASRCESEGEHYLPDGPAELPDWDAGGIARTAVALSRSRPDIEAICCYTRTGRTARSLAAHRPRASIIAFSPDPAVVARLGLVNAVLARQVPEIADADRAETLLRLLRDSALIADGASVVLVSSTAPAGSAPNVIAVHVVGASR